MVEILLETSRFSGLNKNLSLIVKGAFDNYVDKKGLVGDKSKSTLVYVGWVLGVQSIVYVEIFPRNPLYQNIHSKN